MFKTFSAACIIACASAMEVKGAGEWIGGFLTGMVGENHLTEIGACYKGNAMLVEDARDAFTKIRSGKTIQIIKGAEEAASIFKAFPSALATCKNMGDDLKAVEEWAKVFLHPKRLAQHVLKETMLHHKAVGADVKSEMADWSAKNFYHAGIDAADMMNILVGPIKEAYLEAKFNRVESAMVGMPVTGPPKFIAGFLTEFVEEMELKEIEDCYDGGKGDATIVADALKLFEEGKKAEGLAKMTELVSALPKELALCKESKDEVQAIEAWALQFKSKSTIIAKFSKAMLLHHKQVTKDIELIKSDAADQKYLAAGQAAADLVKLVLGPVDVSPSAKLMTKVSSTVDCTSDSDKAAWAKISPSFGNDVSACAGLSTKYGCTSIFKMKGDCVASCMASTQGLSASCSAAFGDLAVCGFKNCKSACISGDPNSKSCVTCNEQKCDKAFHDATGFEVKCAYDMNCNGDKLSLPSPKSVPLFVAGLLDTFVEENNLSEIEKCYDGKFAIQDNLIAALKDIQSKHWVNAIKALQAFAADIPAELTNCKDLSTDISAIEAWAKIFTNKVKLGETIAKNLLLHKGKITTDVETVKSDWTDSQFFQAGQAAGDALILAVGPVHPKHHFAALQ